MSSRHYDAVELGYEPAISGAPVALDRRAAPRRWLAATALMGIAAGLLVSGALWTSGMRARRVAAPSLVIRRLPRQAVAEGGRGDAAVRRTRAGAPADAAVRIERLADSGAVKPFTRVSARLAAIDPVARPDEPTAAASPPPLPPIILYGASHPPLAPAVSAYAAEEPSLTRRAILRPTNVTTVPRGAAPPDIERRVVVARPGDGLVAILTALGATTADAQAILAALAPQGGVGPEFAGGEIVSVWKEPADGALLKIELERPGGAAVAVAVARADAGAYRRVVAEPAVATPAPASEPPAHAASGATLRESLYALARSHHVEEAVFAEVLQLCGRDFDLEKPLDPDDEAELIYGPNELDLPELAYVEIKAQGRARRYYRFTAPDDGGADYYDEDGRSATKFLLRKPVLAGKLGDGFGWRIHPVLRDRRFHEGVDYSAPYGSPIAAAGEGVVELISEHWGYGKYIRIRHDLGYETTYAHVAGFPRGLKVGDRVRQGETIAYVGSTGLSTGPHLYYEVRINGHNVDPLTVRLAAGRVLQGEPLAAFERAAREIEDLARAPGETEASSASEFGTISR